MPSFLWGEAGREGSPGRRDQASERLLFAACYLLGEFLSQLLQTWARSEGCPVFHSSVHEPPSHPELNSPPLSSFCGQPRSGTEKWPRPSVCAQTRRFVLQVCTQPCGWVLGAGPGALVALLPWPPTAEGKPRAPSEPLLQCQTFCWHRESSKEAPKQSQTKPTSPVPAQNNSSLSKGRPPTWRKLSFCLLPLLNTIGTFQGDSKPVLLQLLLAQHPAEASWPCHTSPFLGSRAGLESLFLAASLLMCLSMVLVLGPDLRPLCDIKSLYVWCQIVSLNLL